MNEEDERSIADLFIDQVEFADVLVINKIDLVSEPERERLKAILRKLNSKAVVVESERGKVSLDQILDTGRFDMEEAMRGPGWLAELQAEHTPETEEYGIGSFAFRARRPFHPERFWHFLHTEWPGLLRSKGYFWLASRHGMVGMWSQAGGTAEYRPVGYWWAGVAKDRWPTDDESLLAIMKEWQEPFGDRRQELVYIGQNLPKEEMLGRLEACLLTDEEMAMSPAEWTTFFTDPFPSWLATPEELQEEEEQDLNPA
jgi:G3E family GTPase